MAVYMKERTYIKDLQNKVGEEVSISGWVDVRRDQGKMIFLEIRDFSGIVQGVILPGSDAMEAGQSLRDEWVVRIGAKVNERPERNKQPEKENGTIELEILNIEVLNKAHTPNFDIHTDGLEIGEEVRLKYKYLDLRRKRLQKNIRNRSKITTLVRNFLSQQNFVEIETPILTKSTPEGARDYVVPSRLYPGNFYALPQSPQQYKQLLMAGGMERYFQFAKCMRDEDTRGDRQPEFTQLDMEMSFVEMEDVMNLNEELLIKIVKEIYPEKRIQQIPFPRMSYKDAMEKYGSDRPDIREDKNDPNLLAFLWVVDFPFFESTAKSDNANMKGSWTFTHNPFSRPIPEDMDKLMNEKDIGEIITSQYDIILNGYEIGGGSIRNHEKEALEKVFDIMGYNKEEVESDFSHMLDALDGGCPPHGGIAWGFDRLVMILENEPNIREVIAFPKNGEGKDLMMQSPSKVSDKQLDELGISLKKDKK
ncbi:MAG: aspartate--tRNA ligase [Candidatus Nomurabacteria bacterium]|nr:MAG: aspartate--tRNA ligase [Candidatus Nomurabacteria bacterium]